MEKMTVKKGQVLHRKGEAVQKLEIVHSGVLAMTDGNEVEVHLGSGTVAGAIYLPGEKYAFDYVACEDSTLMTLNYQTEEDIAEAVGYSSHSKFSICFKKYKGMYPKDIKKYNSKKNYV